MRLQFYTSIVSLFVCLLMLKGNFALNEICRFDFASFIYLFIKYEFVVMHVLRLSNSLHRFSSTCLLMSAVVLVILFFYRW